MNKKRILIVDDEYDLCHILKHNLQSNGFIADVTYSAEDALKKELSDYDLFLLDVMMEGVSGFELLKIIRNEKKLDTPVVFITAMTSEEHLLEGFSHGADDYIKKPFSVSEVVVRVHAVLKRAGLKKEEAEYGLNLDNNRKRVFLDKEPVDLTKTEYDILDLLLKQPGKVYSRDEILNKIWTDQHYVLGRTVDVNITRIRKKLGTHGKCIVTRSGYGYYFDDRKIPAKT
jgi:DNA-binding response OmpR family regulator